jgi:hypothetical protein
VELTKQMQVLQPESNLFQPIKWTDRNGQEQSSAVFIHSVQKELPSAVNWPISLLRVAFTASRYFVRNKKNCQFMINLINYS